MKIKFSSYKRVIGYFGCFICVLWMMSSLSACSGSSIGSKRDIANGNSDSSIIPDSENDEMTLIKKDPLWEDPESINAVIISDLHYTGKKKIDHQSVPGIGVAEEITDTIIREVIAKHPDVFIMTGDNTNSGSAEDVAELISKLQEIKKNGISVIITTGNHDFDRMDESEYENAYFELLDPIDRDDASLSYTAIVNDVVFLAMDDKALHLGAQGEFSSKTMQWLQTMLKKYEGQKIIFLSHHNVLYGAEGQGAKSNVIHNPDLSDVLRDGGVKVAVTGHMHTQYITESDGLWEILSGMPFAGRHLMGNLTVGKDRMIYYAEPIDFDTYGTSVRPELETLEKETSAFMQETFASILESEGLTGQKKDNVLKIINRFFMYYEDGTLAEHSEELKAEFLYRDMIKALWNHNYGPWIQNMIETTEHSGRILELSM